MPAKRLSLGLVNVYFVGEPGAAWALVDTGLPWHFSAIVRAAQERYGRGKAPEAIWLTHGHADHVGSALALAAYWDVPLYAHPDELPYLTGKCDYPPADPTACGGWLSLAARLGRTRATDLRPWVQPLPRVLLGDWQWCPLPGHTPGSVGFWHEPSRTLLAGDALMTVHADHWRVRPGLTWPPQPFTTDWFAARKSLDMIAAMAPATLAVGHGAPLTLAEGLAQKLELMRLFAANPRSGRYVGEPVRLDAERAPILTPVPPDPAPRVVKGLVLGAAALTALYLLKKKIR